MVSKAEEVKNKKVFQNFTVLTGGDIFAECKGSKDEIYQVKIFVDRKGSLELEHSCTCPVFYTKPFCKHVLALMMYINEEYK